MGKIIAITLIVLIALEFAACGVPADNSGSTEVPETECVTIVTEVSSEELSAMKIYELAAEISDLISGDVEGGNFSVISIGKSIIISFSMDGLDSLVDGLYDDYRHYLEYWNDFLNGPSFANLYSEVSVYSAMRGFNGIDIVQNILSSDEKTVFATFTNGKLTYNIADEVPGANVQWYAAGMYKVGVDIPAGEYFIQKEGTLSAYMAVYSDSTGDSILENENFNTFHFITVEDGQYLEVSRGKFTSVDNVSLTYDPQNLTEGMYRVGIDIPAGEYRLECTSSYSGYVCVYPTSRSDRRIKTNDNFENNKYITVSDGEYLLLSRCVGSIIE